MACPVELGRYKYCYGTANQANREMRFLRYPNGRIQASIYALFTPLGSKEISTVSDDQMIVEMKTTSEKMANLMALRRKDAALFPGPLEKSLSSLSAKEQEKIIAELEPKGQWRIEITNGFGEDPRFESVASLSFFNPS